VPSPGPALGPDRVRQVVEECCFEPAERARVGVELEWLTFDSEELEAELGIGEPAGPGSRVLRSKPGAAANAELRQIVGGAERPGGSCLTFEPGGQVELSSPPCDDVETACEALSADATVVKRLLALHDVGLVGMGLDPYRPPRLMVRSPRYDAMERYFAWGGDAGRKMMCCTAAVQVNLDTGAADETAGRWELAHALGPTLVAAFAHSPFTGGSPSGAVSTRIETWWAIDPSRTAPADRGKGHVDDWADYALDARVMLIRRSPDEFVALERPLSFREWMARGHELGFPTEDDLDYHLSTLFPPVRPRGRLEIRYLDALAEPWWRVAAAVVTSLLDDPESAESARRATTTCATLWRAASTEGLAHPALATSARLCFEAAQDGLDRLDADRGTRDLVANYHDRFVAQGRCPGDDLLDEWLASGRMLPVEETLEASWT
jgi:glutamate--cysteine ligase